MSTGRTKDLIKLVEKRAGEANSSIEAQQLIIQGADIKAPISSSLTKSCLLSPGYFRIISQSG
jgi:hypothetical protein